MNAPAILPRILVIDDLFGRTHPDRRNEERASLCGLYLLQDISGDQDDKRGIQKLKRPLAQAYFYRGQSPVCSTEGDTVENDLDGALKLIADGWTKPPYWSLVLLDLCFYTGLVTGRSNKKALGMPEGRSADDDPRQYFGLQILAAIKANFPGLPVVILSSKPEDEVSFDYTRLGALGFIPRADESAPDLLKDHIYRNALLPDLSGEIIGHSKAIMFALREIRRSAAQGGRRNILFRGETGTGKRLFASYSHNQRISESQNIPFSVVNCPQISQERFASELFGHKKGAFTDAIEDKPGIIEKTNGGDIFLDEIADLPAGVQAGILKVIEERTFTRLGDTNSRYADVRFLSATNSTLLGLREDLLMRLTEGGTITLPPLRERKDDIPLLVEKFIRDAEKATNARERKIESAAIDKLMQYIWPGNVRELQNRIFEAVQQYSQLPYLVPEHINLPEVSSAPLINSIPAYENLPVSLNQDDTGFIEYALPEILREQHMIIVKYIKTALETCRDRRTQEPNYPETWYAMTGQNIKSSSTCQRNIGNFIFQLDDNDILKFMRDSKLFSKAVMQCGRKIQSAKSRVTALENLFVKHQSED